MARVLKSEVLPNHLPFMPDSFLGACVVNGIIYINARNEIIKFNPLTRVFETLCSKPSSNVSKIKYYNGFIYYVSGTSVYKVDIESGEVTLAFSFNYSNQYDSGNNNFEIINGNIYMYAKTRYNRLYQPTIYYSEFMERTLEGDYVKNGSLFSPNRYFYPIFDYSQFGLLDDNEQKFYVLNKDTSKFAKFVTNPSESRDSGAFEDTLLNLASNYGGFFTQDNELYFISDSKRLYKINPIALTKTLVGEITDNVPDECVPVVVGNDIYLVGGKLNGSYVDSILHIYYEEYDLDYNVKNGNGSVTHLELTNQSPITKIETTLAGNNVVFKLTTLSGVVINSYQTTPPTGYILSGYALSPNAKRPLFVVNSVFETNITQDVTFYEVYAKYQPPVTNFDIILYTNSAEENRVDKTSYLNVIGTISGVLKETTSIVNPSITIEYNGVPNFNYVYIAIFNRYYFVSDITHIKNNLWTISLKCDVLFSYKDTILTQTGIIRRNENDYDEYLQDENVIIDNNPDYEIVEIENDLLDSSGESSSRIILDIFGGGTYNE